MKYMCTCIPRAETHVYINYEKKVPNYTSSQKKRAALHSKTNTHDYKRPHLLANTKPPTQPPHHTARHHTSSEQQTPLPPPPPPLYYKQQ